ncbi:Integrase core domain containing protein [Gossypium australe]|uniref:Integrase core domain containing protein n=1 Tax=Gossypium australe TaxID=47621 RepID=A0A5B6VIC1_9ROSI|nr:Integrase core domain containing protein [Gossypium australe]
MILLRMWWTVCGCFGSNITQMALLKGIKSNLLPNDILNVLDLIITSNSSLFILHRFEVTVYILIYANDIIVAGNIPNRIRYIIDALSNIFS